jgi:Holliday junction resolvase-like predicted endonuclease|tara:strand:- start:118 stop:537 length:420 start_codon:yes stop_codon:yes gene_type:complete
MINFNSPNSKVGDNFEKDILNYLKENNYINLQSNITMKDLGIEIDVYAEKNDTIIYGECKGGKDGAMRTDNVKKALASAPLIKKKYPNAKFICFFSKQPNKNSSSYNMLKHYMDFGLVDDVIYVNPSNSRISNLEEFFG